MQAIKEPFVLIALLAAAAALGWAVFDYRRWKALGKGGVPYNLYGWMLVTGFRFYKREPIGTSIYNGRIGDAEDSRRLPDLPLREGPRPQIGVHPVPHRQLDQPAQGDARIRLDQTFDDFVSENGRYVRYANSFYEKRNQAVTLLDPGCGHALAQISQGEVAHIHPSDGSMHMIFSASDAKQVIEKGWGERHPLSGAAKFNLPDTYLLIYAPRNEAEVKVVGQLLLAAVEHMSLNRCILPGAEEQPGRPAVLVEQGLPLAH